jgi:bifunctional non-homologous end joining protein LigD
MGERAEGIGIGCGLDGGEDGFEGGLCLCGRELGREHLEGRGERAEGIGTGRALDGGEDGFHGGLRRPGRTTDWLKTKCTRRQEFVIGGWRSSTASAQGLGSLLVGHYDGGKLLYAGNVGTGFGDRLGREIVAKLDGHRREASPFVDVPRAEARGANWVEPVYVADVEFTAWTRDGHLRHPSFKGMRLDKVTAGRARRRD